MKIGIDISPVVYGQGVSRYTSNLVSHLLKYDENDQFLLLGYSLRRKDSLYHFANSLKGNNYRVKVIGIPPLLADIIWNRLHSFEVERFIGKMDVYHSSDWVQPPTKAKKVTTIHDLVPILYPKLSHPRIVSTHKRRLYHVKREVDSIIVPSKQTKTDLCNLGFRDEIINVIPEAPDSMYRRQDEEAVMKVRNKYSICGEYILALGINQRKNTDRLIESFKRLKNNNLSLVIVGERKIRTKSGSRIIYTGHVLDADLPSLYTGAASLVYPSLYEGFGLPILEAFACGTVVVTSNLGSMKEISGDAAILVDPYDIYSIKSGIEKALDSRNDYILKGSRRLKRFKWSKITKKTINVYKKL